MLRAALYEAVRRKGEEGLRYDALPAAVFDALALPMTQYATDPDVKGGAKRRTDEALRDVLEYRVYRDLQRGWRITSPNLEQTGLLHIDYDDLADCVARRRGLGAGAPQLDWRRPRPAPASGVGQHRHPRTDRAGAARLPAPRARIEGRRAGR